MKNLSKMRLPETELSRREFVAGAGGAVVGMSALGLPAGSGLREHLPAGAPHMRPLVMGLILILVMRFRPDGLIPARGGAGPGR